MIQSQIIDQVEMKISRKEKRKEFDSLIEFINFADKLNFAGKKTNLDDHRRGILGDVHQFLSRELTNRLEKGRKKKQTGANRLEKIQKYKDGKLSLAEVMTELNISRATFFRYIDEAGKEDSKKIEREKQLAKIENDIHVFQLLSEGVTKLTSEQIEKFQQGREIVAQYLETTDKRRKNLSEGREKFKEKFENDPKFAKYMTEVRSQSAKNMCEIKTKEEREKAGSKGGISRKDSLSKDERVEIAKKANRSRRFLKQQTN